MEKSNLELQQRVGMRAVSVLVTLRSLLHLVFLDAQITFLAQIAVENCCRRESALRQSRHTCAASNQIIQSYWNPLRLPKDATPHAPE
jgi:hypothetical protein